MPTVLSCSGLPVLLAFTTLTSVVGDCIRDRATTTVSGWLVGPNAPEPTSPPVSPITAGPTPYVDRKYGFSITYPRGFSIQPQDVAKFSRFTPAPVASIFFMNPTMAAGHLAGIEPPDLELRIYDAGPVASLERWLRSVGFAPPGTPAEIYRGTAFTGLKVCHATMIAPGCSVFVLRGRLVYQLTPGSREGESMIDAFTLLPSKNSGAPSDHSGRARGGPT